MLVSLQLEPETMQHDLRVYPTITVGECTLCLSDTIDAEVLLFDGGDLLGFGKMGFKAPIDGVLVLNFAIPPESMRFAGVGRFGFWVYGSGR